MHAVRTTFDIPNLPLNKTNRICERYDILKIYDFGDYKIQHHTSVLLIYLILGPACQIRLAIITLTEYNQYNNLVNLLNFCNCTFDLLKGAAEGHPRTPKAYLDYLDEMRLLTYNLTLQCKREHAKFSVGRPLISHEKDVKTILCRLDHTSKMARNQLKKLEPTGTLLVREKLSTQYTANCSSQHFKETEIANNVYCSEDYSTGDEYSEHADLKSKQDRCTNADVEEINADRIDTLNQFQLNHDGEEAESGKDVDDNTDYGNNVYGYITFIGCRCGNKKYMCSCATQNY